MMQLIVQDSGTLGILTLRGRFSRIHAGELRSHLTRGINRTNRLIVNCEQVAAFDMTCLRLLCTAYRVSRVLNKGFVLAGDRTALFRHATGAGEYIRCAEDALGCESGCLWTDSGPDGAAGGNTSGSLREIEPDRAAA